MYKIYRSDGDLIFRTDSFEVAKRIVQRSTQGLYFEWID